MANSYIEKDPVKCWNLLGWVLSLGHTIPFVYKKDEIVYRLSEGIGGWGYNDTSCAEYLLDDIQFALFDQKIERVQLTLDGRHEGPVCDFYTFVFTKAGLVEVNAYYNTD